MPITLSPLASEFVKILFSPKVFQIHHSCKFGEARISNIKDVTADAGVVPRLCVGEQKKNQKCFSNKILDIHVLYLYAQI